MLNRRQIRIKILQILFAYYSEEKPDAAAYEKLLHQSFDKFRDLYLMMLMLITEMQALAIEKIEAGRNKKLPSKEDLHPNTRFVTNALLRVLANSKRLEKAAKDSLVSWNDNPDLLRQVFRMLIETDDYKEYMANKERSFELDKEYLLRFFRRHLVNFELMTDHLEEKNIFWIDDLDLVASMVLKTLKGIKEDDEDITLLPLWNEENGDKDFMIRLFRQSLALGAEHEKMIGDVASNWDTDRIALMDMVLMKMALAEARTFDSIPVKVTLNEYLELSRYYSTDKSNVFINGVLDQLFTDLQSNEKIKKVGRGLIQ